MHIHMRRFQRIKCVFHTDRRDVNERGESNLTHAVQYAFLSTAPNVQDIYNLSMLIMQYRLGKNIDHLQREHSMVCESINRGSSFL